MLTGLRAVSEEPRLRALRSEVRRFLQEEIDAGGFAPRADQWMSGMDVDFSKRLAARGWVGMTIPEQYGGHGRSALERYVVTEELLAAGAPVGAHWIADRQMAPGILRNGTEAQKQTYLPGIARAEHIFAIGMSEPDAGSDLASVRSRAREDALGWRLQGTKVWTSNAHVATAMVLLARTDPGTSRHQGLTQFVIDLPHPDIHIRPIRTIDGEHHFNEVVFDDALVPAQALLGVRGEGWRQVTAELANERSGPERIMSTLPLLREWAPSISGELARDDLGRLIARLTVLRQASFAVADCLQRGANPALEAALVKDLGTTYEGEVVDVVRRHVATGPAGVRALAEATVARTPAFTLRGGTTEMLRSVVAKGLLNS